MGAARRIVAAAVMVISVLMLLASLTGIVGAWILRGQLATELTDIVTVAETRADATQQRLARLDTVIAQARDQVDAVQQEVQAFGSDLEQNRPLLAAISDRLALDLTPLVGRAREILSTVRQTVDAVNAAVEAIDAIPFISVPVPELDTVRKLSQDIEDFRTEVQNLRTTIDERRGEVIQGAVSLITTPASEIGATLDGMQATVSGYSQQIRAVQDGLANLKSAIGSGLTWAALVLSLFLMWFAFSQVALLALAWQFFSGRDLIVSERQQATTGQQVRSGQVEEEETQGPPEITPSE